jgi:hypothetical protein
LRSGADKKLQALLLICLVGCRRFLSGSGRFNGAWQWKHFIALACESFRIGKPQDWQR